MSDATTHGAALPLGAVDPAPALKEEAAGAGDRKAERRARKEERRARKEERRARKEEEAAKNVSPSPSAEDLTEAARREEKRRRKEEKKRKRAASEGAETNVSPSPSAEDLAGMGAEKEKVRRTAGAQDVGGGAPVASPAEYRKAHDIRVDGTVEAPFQTFEDAQFAPALSAALAEQGYQSPTAIQAQAWPVALNGRDLVAVAKTGSGKTCGFMMPALQRIVADGVAAPPRKYRTPEGYWRTEAVEPSVLVLAPTRELAQQIGEEAVKFTGAAGARVVVLFGGASKVEQMQAMARGADVVVATPGRIEDFLLPKNGRDPLISAKKAKYVVLDEADRMLDMGFEPSLRTILGECPPVGERQTLMFSATWPKAVQAIARKFTSPSHAQIFIGDSSQKLVCNPNVAQTVEFVREDEKTARLVELMRQSDANDRTIVFAGTKRRCEELSRELARKGFRSAGAIHGDKLQHEREHALRQFKTGDRPLLVATDVAARGLDIPDVKAVYVCDFPGDVADYVHRIGRTGRAGKTGRSTAFFCDKDRPIARQFAELLDAAKQEVPDWLRTMAASSRGGGGGRGGRRYGGGGGRGQRYGGGGGGGGNRYGGGGGGNRYGGGGRRW